MPGKQVAVNFHRLKTPKNQSQLPRKKNGHTRFFQVIIIIMIHVGVSLNGGTPKTPQNDHF